MKKFLIMFLISLSCALTAVAVGCSDGDASSSDSSSVSDSSSISVQGEMRDISFVGGEGYSFTGEGIEEGDSDHTWTAKAEDGKPFTFQLDLGAFYQASTPTVFAGNVALSASEDGTYTLNVTKDVEITVTGVKKDVSNMTGTGAMDDAFVVSLPVDLLYIAEQVNKGVERYRTGNYILANDIDCKGETLEIIGDGSTNASGNVVGYFSGCFSCFTTTDSEGTVTGAERFTISNFKIRSNDSNYVGLFGCVQADLSSDSSGLFYGIRIDNFTIEAGWSKLPESNRSLYCGGLIGYGVGVRTYLCDATNGKINVNANENYFSYAGGLIGIQQGYYMQDYAKAFPAETAYATVDTDVTVNNGLVINAGGITGYLCTNNLLAPALVHNSYSTGNVNGGMRAGGIVGELGQHCSVAGSYSSGDVSAKLSKTSESVLAELPASYRKAYAGGLVGYAENDTVVNDSFAAGKISASASNSVNALTHYAIAGGDDAGSVSIASKKYVVLNCLDGLDLSNALSILKNDLGWQTYNWNMSDNVYPTINYSDSEESVITVVSVKYVGKDLPDGQTITVGSRESEEVSYQDTYAPLVDAFNSGDLSIYLTASNGWLSYGYFFDEACTKPVPYSYLTTRNVTLYVGFADPTPIAGTYNIATDNANGAVLLTLGKDGIATYTDGTKTDSVNYQYDGETVLLEGARLAKYYQGEIDPSLSVNGDTTFDLNRYQFYYFKALPQNNGSLKLFDGVYFTESDPLSAYPTASVLQGEYYTVGESVTEYVFRPDGTVSSGGESYAYSLSNGVIAIATDEGNLIVNVSDLKKYDDFRGKWQKSATVHKYFVFDGIGGWTYEYVSYERKNGNATPVTVVSDKGVYTLSDDQTQLTFTASDSVTYTVTFDSLGNLTVKAGTLTQTYCKDESFKGKWYCESEGISLTLNGINEAGRGSATVEYGDGYYYSLSYEASETDGYLCLYYGDTAFGYFRYNTLTNALTATVYNPYDYETGYTTCNFALIYDFDGEWIGNDETFDSISFDGLGSYVYETEESAGVWTSTLTIGDEKVSYTLNDSTLQGRFTYEGKVYEIELNEDEQRITITASDVNATLERKDEFADTEFVDKATGLAFSFDGKGNLDKGGTLTVNGANYLYKAVAGETYAYAIYQDSLDPANKIGEITQTKTYYAVTLASARYQLYVSNDLMGEWAMSGEFKNPFVIGPTDLEGNVTATFKGINVKMSYVSPTMLSFYCEIEQMPITYYVFSLYDNNGNLDTIALSEYASTSYGNYVFCSKADEMFGQWVSSENSDFTIEFDGVQSSYYNGIANLSYKNSATPYYYRTYFKNGQTTVLLWSQELLDGKTQYYKLTLSDGLTGDYVSESKGKSFTIEESDALYMTEAKDAKDPSVTYVFDGSNVNGKKGTLTASNGKSYRYEVTAYNSDNTATLTLTEIVEEGETAKTYTATLDYSDSANVTISLAEAE